MDSPALAWVGLALADGADQAENAEKAEKPSDLDGPDEKTEATGQGGDVEASGSEGSSGTDRTTRDEVTEATETTEVPGTVEAAGRTTGQVGSFPDAAVYVLAALVLALAAAVVVLFLRQAGRGRRTHERRQRQHRGQGDRSESGAGSKEAPGTVRAKASGGATVRAHAKGEGICDTIAPSAAGMPIDAVVGIGKLHGQGARDQQQDSFGVSDAAMAVTHGQLAVVCDGMGGLENGAAVSSVAVETILHSFLLLPQGTDPLHALESLVVDANMAVNAMLGPEGIRACGSTLVMALVRDGMLSFVSIGDSRICLYRDGALMQLNREHDFEGELVLKAINGEMGLIEALSDERGQGLVSYLGMGKISAIDIPCAPVALCPADMVILMSDGVYNALTEAEISGALALGDPEGAAQALGDAIEGKAFENQDNYTAVVIAV